MSWLALLVAGLFEVGFTTCMKLSVGFTKVGWTLAFIACAALSFVFLSVATRTIPLGVGYAIWTGLGTIGTIVLGRILFRESLDPGQYFFLALILVGILGVKLSTVPKDGRSATLEMSGITETAGLQAANPASEITESLAEPSREPRPD